MRAMIRSCVLALVLVWCSLPSAVKGQEDQYLRIYDLIGQADNFRDAGRTVDALGRYTEAQAALQRFEKDFPEWNSNVIRYRLKYVGTELATLSTNASATASRAQGAGTNRTVVAAPASSATDQRVSALQAEVRQLQIDRAMLEAKLKEALSAQPAAFDPRELAKAQEQVVRLQKENDLLQVSAARQQSQTNFISPKALDEVKQQLADANRTLAEQTNLVRTLLLEKAALQQKLGAAPVLATATNTAAQTAEQVDPMSKVALERTALQLRVKTLMSEAEAAAALRKENDALKKQLANLNLVPDGLADSEKKLAEARAQIATLQSDKELLQRDKAELEKRLKQASHPDSTAKETQ